MTRHLEGYLFLSLAMLTVGSTVIVSRIIGQAIPPFTATMLRLAVAFPVFLLLMRLTRTQWPRPEKSEWLILIVQACAGTVAYTALLISGLKLTSGTNAGIIIGTLPVVAAVISISILRERPDRSLIAAILLATAGVCSIALRPGASGRGSVPGELLVGDLLVLAAVTCEGFFILLNKRLRTPIRPLALSTLMTGLGLALSLIPAIVEIFRLRGSFQFSATAYSAFAAILYYAIVPTVGGFILWYAGAARVRGMEASLFTALAPVSAIAFAVILLGESPQWPQLAGAGCVLLAVASVSFRKATARTPPASGPS